MSAREPTDARYRGEEPRWISPALWLAYVAAGALFIVALAR